MTFSKTHRGLLVAAALLALPVVMTSWWMLSPDTPATPSAEVAAPEEVKPSPAHWKDSAKRMQAEVPSRVAFAGTGEDGKMAEDFGAYAATLAAQEYSERNVRELVACRITAVFEARRTAIRRQSGNDADIQAQLEMLNREQGAFMEQVLGAEEPPLAAATAETALTEATLSGEDRPPLMPAVMAEAMPATVKTEEQAAVWQKLRNDFVQAIGGENQNPADPHYRKRWVRAESEADQRFRLLFGDNAYVQMQMRAQQDAVLRAQGSARQ